ncbi:DNA-processing protein DprA [Intestinibacter bartlettii]|uniref:DNA-processing protein DprA n=1 Tax=Intestinibacter bartlettii TaxID=261299 RepID=UPI00242AFC0C|nr:DNA-processing protein DprA [Intestinibacter bartlettii]
MEIYIIALKELGLSNNIIRDLLNNITFEDFTQIFKGKYLEVQFKYNLNLDTYSKKLSDIESLSNAINTAKNILIQSKKNKIKHILITNKNYPKNLKNIDDAPVILYYKGRGFYKKHEKSICCVGTRKPTEFTYNVLDSIIPKLVEEGFTIVSGLALGTDTYSHKVCLNNNGTTIAVLAHGLDTIYPKENEQLAENILKNNGLLVSEYPIGTKADKFRFVKRNRIVTGLAKSTLVFETKEKSGTMHSVNFAIKQKKNIFCPWPRISTELTIPLQRLIQSGVAKAISNRSSYDVVVYGSGYKIKKDKNAANKFKSNLLMKNINNINIDASTIYNNFNSLNEENKKNISFEVSESLHSKITEFAKTHNVSKKELFNAFIIGLCKD